MSEALHTLPIFTSLSPDTIDHLTRGLPRKTFKKGETLLRQGARDLKGYLLLDGKVGVFSESKDGMRTAIIFHEAPFVLGVIELARERAYLGTVEAIEPCSTIVITRKDYLRMLQSSHQVAVNMVQLLSNLLYKTGTDRRIRQFGRVEHLVANTLCSFAQLYGEEHRYGILVRKDVNKSEIAEILGVARRSVIRAMEELEGEGLVQVQGKTLVIPDLEALRKKALQPILTTPPAVVE